MELKDLVGLKNLSGIDTSVQEIEKYGDMQKVDVFLFILDDLTYMAIENPDDGYRSYMDEIEITNNEVKNKFPKQQVYGVMRGGRYWGEKNDVIDFYDTTTNQVVLSVGTDNSDYYYPSCVMSWHPENLAINKDR